MADYKAPLRDMRFVLNEVFEVASTWAQLPALADTVDAETVEAILEEAGYELKDVVRVGVWLEDPRDFWSFNKVFGEYFTPEHAPARACVQAKMMVDCKVEIDCVAYKKKG